MDFSLTRNRREHKGIIPGVNVLKEPLSTSGAEEKSAVKMRTSAKEKNDSAEPVVISRLGG
jgi:hypothetical protein